MRWLELMSFQGGIVNAPSVDQIRSAIADLPYKADSGLHFRGEEPTASLIFTFHNELGFCVLLELSDEQSLVLSAAPDDQSIVETWLCQNPVRMPRSHFTTVRAALDAATIFADDIENGGRRASFMIGPWVVFSPEDPR